MNNTLEGHKFFPYMAWATIILFAFFTYSLASNLQDDLERIDRDVTLVEKSLTDTVIVRE